jgi:RNA-directed DNA polymerase
VVWTDRMLTALEQVVRGSRWLRLIDKVFSELCLFAAARQVLANRGAACVDHISVDDFNSRLSTELRKLSVSLRDGTYGPQAIRRVDIPRPGSKELRLLGRGF